MEVADSFKPTSLLALELIADAKQFYNTDIESRMGACTKKLLHP
jgi:hypothetical protein